MGHILTLAGGILDFSRQLARVEIKDLAELGSCGICYLVQIFLRGARAATVILIHSNRSRMGPDLGILLS